MKGDLMDLRVTIIRPEANETPQEAFIGLAQLIAKRIRDSEQRQEQMSVVSVINLAEGAEEI